MSLEGGRERREGRDDYYTYYSDGTMYSVYRPTMKNYIYIYNNDVTYYVITFKHAAQQWYLLRPT